MGLMPGEGADIVDACLSSNGTLVEYKSFSDVVTLCPIYDRAVGL